MKIKFSYQTLLLPPPFAFAFTLEIDLQSEQPEVDFLFEYLNRDVISEEEIINEGYSLDKQFSWKGKLHQNWSDVLSTEISDLKLANDNQDESIYLHTSIEKNGSIKEGHVVDIKKWDFLLQELQQAIYETAKLEAPLSIEVLDCDINLNYMIEAHFSSRVFTVNQLQKDWDQLSNVLSSIFKIPFEEMDGEKQPHKNGLWVRPQDDIGLYFEASAETASELRKALQ